MATAGLTFAKRIDDALDATFIAAQIPGSPGYARLQSAIMELMKAVDAEKNGGKWQGLEDVEERHRRADAVIISGLKERADANKEAGDVARANLAPGSFAANKLQSLPGPMAGIANKLLTPLMTQTATPSPTVRAVQYALTGMAQYRPNAGPGSPPRISTGYEDAVYGARLARADIASAPPARPAPVPPLNVGSQRGTLQTADYKIDSLTPPPVRLSSTASLPWNELPSDWKAEFVRQFGARAEAVYTADLSRRTGTTSSTSRPAPVPPLNVGATPVDRAPRVAELQAGTRTQKVDGRVMNILEFAAAAAGVNVVVFSGGQPAKGSPQDRPGTRVGSTRHDLGAAADVHLYQYGRELHFTNPDDRKVMAAFISASVAAGATGVGSGPGYMGTSGIHIGFGPSGVTGGPLTAWGADGEVVNAPDWLVAAIQPGAVRTTVVSLQTNLAALGYYKGNIDGLPGNMTLAALNDFAKKGNPVSLSAMPGGYDAFLGTRKPQPGLATPPAERPRPLPARVPTLKERPVLTTLSNAVREGSLRKGDEKPAVREMQRFLNAQGFTDARGQPLKEDGKFGVRTQQAVAAFQATHPELMQDGVVGRRTLAAMIADQRASDVATARSGGIGSDFAIQVDERGVPNNVTAYPGGIPAAVRSVANYAMGAGASLAALLIGAVAPSDSEAASAARGMELISPGYGAGYPLEPGNTFVTGGLIPSVPGGALPVTRDGIAPVLPSRDDFDLSPGFNQGYPEEPGMPYLRGGMGEEPELAYDNALTDHAGVSDELRLGGGGRLGTTFSRDETDALAGAVRGAAAAINLREQRDMGSRFDATIAGGLTLASLGFGGLDASAYESLTGSRMLTLADFGYYDGPRTIAPDGTSLLPGQSYTEPAGQEVPADGGSIDPFANIDQGSGATGPGGGSGDGSTGGGGGIGSGSASGSDTLTDYQEDYYSYSDSLGSSGGIGHA